MPTLKAIAIITRQRPELLNHCLGKISHQTTTTPLVHIIDNDTAKSAYPIYRLWAGKMPINYHHESQVGAPHARNHALKLYHEGWLGFIDDDATANNRWVEEANYVLKKTNAHTGFVVGAVKLANPQYVSALAQHQLHQAWFQKKVTMTKAEPDAIDTKNCLINLRALHKHHIKFDPRYITGTIAGQEDYDLGIQLHQAGYTGYYHPKLIVYHQEKTLGQGLLKKAYLRGILRYRYDRKWHQLDQWICSSPNLRLYLPPFHTNVRRWLSRFKLIGKKYLTAPSIRAKHIALIQEVYLLAYNQGYLDEMRRQPLTQNPSTGAHS